MKYNQRLGRWGEDYAENYLRYQGITILARNVRTPYGEIDIVGRDKTDLIFFEVKTRTSQKFGFPEDSIHFRKRDHLIQSAEYYVQQNPDEEAVWRIDVISIQCDNKGLEPVQIEWFVNAIQ